jgi:hypothetical protein
LDEGSQSELQRAIDRFGGAGLWHRLDSVLLEIESIGGPLPTMKGIGRTFPHFGRVQVFPRQSRAVFFDHAGSLLGNFDAGSVNRAGLVPTGDHRDCFAGIAKYRSWSLEDALYFFGYALSVYLSIPFLLTTLSIQTSPWIDGGFRIDADFPAQIHSHCRRQSFYFDRNGLLKRHDYTADIVGRLAQGAHFTSDYEEMCGLPVARKRQVFFRAGSLVTRIPVLFATLRPLEVVLV